MKAAAGGSSAPRHRGLSASPEAKLLAEGRKLAHKMGTFLATRGLNLSVAESSTGGLLSSLITDIPGSAAYFAGALVPYSYEAHEAILRVDRKTLEDHGAVSEEVAKAMASKARGLMSTDYALAVAGIAGPSGGTPSKPVGLTYVALAADGVLMCERHLWSGGRVENRLASAVAALALLVRVLEQS
jgi:PncC family amidohydrolase